MKSFDLSIYYTHLGSIYHPPTIDRQEYIGDTIELSRYKGSTKEFILHKRKIYKPFDSDRFWKLAKMCNNEEELLEEFEKMLNENFTDETVKFPLDKELPEIPTDEEERTPKDGDPYEWHKTHDVITASAGGKSYKYCKDCKVEVKEQRIFTGSEATITLDGVKTPLWLKGLDSYLTPHPSKTLLKKTQIMVNGKWEDFDPRVDLDHGQPKRTINVN